MDWPNNPFGLAANDGSYFLDLTGYQDAPPYGGVAQAVTVSPGSIYNLTFDLGSDPPSGLPSSILLSISGYAPVVFASTATTGRSNWENQAFQFTALNASTNISLIGNSGGIYIGLDNVDLEFVSASAVPGPMVGAGLPGVMMAFGGLLAWRRRKAAPLVT